MSTKTIYKRIALVAVAALGAGVLSVAPASAATYVNVFTVTNAQAGSAHTDADGNTATQISGANNFVTVSVADTVTSDSGVLTISGSTLTTSDITEVSIAADRLSASQTDVTAYVVPTKTAGTITLKWYRTTSGATSPDVTGQLTITVIDAASKLPSVANSTSIISDDGAATADEKIAAVGLLKTNQVGQIVVTIKDGTAAKTAINDVVLSAVVTGSGLVEGSSAKARVAVQTTAGSGANAGKATFNVYADGTAGTGTITISAGTTVIATETLTFSGAPTKVVATQNLQVTNGIGVLGAATFDGTTGASNGAVTLTVTDANGNPVTNVDNTDYKIIATSSDKTIMSSGTGFAAGVGNGKGAYALTATAATAVVGKSATITYSVIKPDETVLATSAPVTFAVGGTTIATVAIAFDKATYAPGEKATITLTAKDASGFAVADGVTQIFATPGVKYAGLLSSASLTSAPFSHETNTATTLLGGKATATIFMPLTSGPVTVSGATIAGVAGVAGSTITATATVGSSSDLSAITTLINSLIAKINALNKLVAKIQKKVRA